MKRYLFIVAALGFVGAACAMYDLERTTVRAAIDQYLWISDLLHKQKKPEAVMRTILSGHCTNIQKRLKMLFSSMGKPYDKTCDFALNAWINTVNNRLRERWKNDGAEISVPAFTLDGYEVIGVQKFERDEPVLDLTTVSAEGSRSPVSPEIDTIENAYSRDIFSHPFLPFDEDIEGLEGRLVSPSKQ